MWPVFERAGRFSLASASLAIIAISFSRVTRWRRYGGLVIVRLITLVYSRRYYLQVLTTDINHLYQRQVFKPSCQPSLLSILIGIVIEAVTDTVTDILRKHLILNRSMQLGYLPNY